MSLSSEVLREHAGKWHEAPVIKIVYWVKFQCRKAPSKFATHRPSDKSETTGGVFDDKNGAAGHCRWRNPNHTWAEFLMLGANGYKGLWCKKMENVPETSNTVVSPMQLGDYM
jgi:hypothetical protein